MEHDHLTILFDGEEITQLYQDLVQLEVELDDELAGMFRMRLCMLRGEGTWTSLDDEHFRVWTPVSITGGYEDNTEELLSGYITHVRPSFGCNPADIHLDIWGMDGSILMDRVEVLKDWANKKDSDIATEIFQSHGFTPDVEDSGYVHDEALSTIIQRETDMQFLKRLALRNGFECYVQGETAVFKPPQVDEEPQPILAVNFGNETNVSNFSINVDGLAPANVGMYQMDRFEKSIVDVNAEASEQTPLGEIDAAGLLASGMDPGQVFVGMNGASGNDEMMALCQGLYHRAEWFVTGEGEIRANDYGHILLPRKPVTVKGIGETYSGVYYVNHVTHTFTPGGYSQKLKVKRNALMPTGDEDWGESTSLLGGL